MIQYLKQKAKPGEPFRSGARSQLNIQRSFYNGCIKRHELNTQTVFFADGMIGSIFIDALRNHDNGMFYLSALGDKLNELLPFMPNAPANCSTKYALLCDGIF